MLAYYKALLILLLISGTQVAQAVLDPGNYSLSHTVFSTSSQYLAKSWDASTGLVNDNVILDARSTNGQIVHENFSVKRFAIGHRFSSWAGAPVLRVGALSREYRGDQVNVFVTTLRGEQTLKKLYYIYQVGYVPMSEEFQTAYTVDSVLRGGLVSLGGSYRWNDKWRSTFYLQNYFFNDNNTRLNHDVGLLYGIAPGDPWIWVGFGAGRLSNSNINRPYWVPLEFYTIGPRLDVAFTFWEKFRFAGGINLNYFNDVKIGSGRGYYTMNRLFYKVSKGLEFYGAAESIQSSQLGNLWRSNAISGGIAGSW